MVITEFFLNSEPFSDRMERKAWALLTYGLGCLFLAMLFIGGSLRLALCLLFAANLLSLLVLLLLEERWDASHYLALALFALAGAFLVFLLRGSNSPLGIFALIAANLGLAIVELSQLRPVLVDHARDEAADSSISNVEASDDDTDEGELIVEPVLPRKHEERGYTLVTQRGTNLYHRALCRTLKGGAESSLIELSSPEEGEAYGLKACKVCRP
jgi:hypothetical protein